MICKAGLLWDTPQIFTRFIEDCGVCCELITPHLLAAPFFRGQYVALIVPTGFASRRYSMLLPVLRAKQDRLRSFVERGGRLLVFGAAEARPDAYDWLPVPLGYTHGYQEQCVRFSSQDTLSGFLAGYDTSAIACDGHFGACPGEVAAVNEKGEILMVVHRLGEGVVVATTFHEYPSREFLKQFCCGDREIPF